MLTPSLSAAFCRFSAAIYVWAIPFGQDVIANSFIEIREADAIIIAADRSVNKDRFIGKKLLSVGVQDGIRKPEELIRKALNGDIPVYRDRPVYPR